MPTTYIELKDINLEAHRALTVIKAICTMYKGACKVCPLGVHTSRNNFDYYSCGLKEYTPRFLKIQDVIPTRLVEQIHKDTPQNDTYVCITGKR